MPYIEENFFVNLWLELPGELRISILSDISIKRISFDFLIDLSVQKYESRGNHIACNVLLLKSAIGLINLF